MGETSKPKASVDTGAVEPLKFESTGDADLDAAIRRMDAALVKAAARAAEEPPRAKWSSDDDPAWGPHPKADKPT